MTGRSPLRGSGLRPFGAEPQDASQAKPLVPNAAQIANDSDFLIEADVPIPERQTARVARYGTPKYPWAAMREGDSFLVSGDGSAQQQIRVNTASNVRSRKNAGEHYITRVVPGGVRVWRVPVEAEPEA